MFYFNYKAEKSTFAPCESICGNSLISSTVIRIPVSLVKSLDHLFGFLRRHVPTDFDTVHIPCCQSRVFICLSRSQSGGWCFRVSQSWPTKNRLGARCKSRPVLCNSFYSAKEYNVWRNPRISVCVEHEYSYVTISGNVELVDDRGKRSSRRSR